MSLEWRFLATRVVALLLPADQGHVYIEKQNIFLTVRIWWFLQKNMAYVSLRLDLPE